MLLCLQIHKRVPKKKSEKKKWIKWCVHINKQDTHDDAQEFILKGAPGTDASLCGGWLDRWQARDAPLGCLSRSVGPSRFLLSLLAAARRGRSLSRPAELDIRVACLSAGDIRTPRHKSEDFSISPALSKTWTRFCTSIFYFSLSLLLINDARKKEEGKKARIGFTGGVNRISPGSTIRRWC